MVQWEVIRNVAPAPLDMLLFYIFFFFLIFIYLLTYLLSLVLVVAHGIFTVVHRLPSCGTQAQ